MARLWRWLSLTALSSPAGWRTLAEGKAGRPPPPVKRKTEGPKGRSISAQGEALGFAVPLAGGLKDRARLPFQGKGLVGCGVSQGFALG